MLAGNKERERQLRALMLVLPYHSENLSSEDLQEIYTKSPITKIVNDSKKKPVQSHVVKVPESFEFTKSRVTTFRPLPNISPSTINIERGVNPSTYHPKKYSSAATPKPLTNEEIQDVLSSLGLAANFDIVNQFNKVTNVAQRKPTKISITTTTPEPTTVSIPETTTPETSGELGPELQKLLQTYGLLNENGEPIELPSLPLDIDSEPLASELLKNHKMNDDESDGVKNLETLNLKLEEESTTASTTTEAPQKISLTQLYKPEDYSGFRPLTIIEDGMDKEMEDFLKQFGLIDNLSSRGQKSIKTKEEKPMEVKTATTTETPVFKLDSEFFSDDQMSLLDHIGFSMENNKKGRKINPKTASNIFKSNHLEKSKGSQDDYRKLEELLETIQELDKLNANLTEEELNKLELQRFNLTDALLSQIPHPLELAGNAYALPLKNEIKFKRQNPETKDSNTDSDSNGNSSSLEIISTTSADAKSNIIEALKLEQTTEEPTTTTTKTSPTTEEERKNVLEDELDPLTGEEEPLPPPRRSGFYFMADWNSFLEVGEDPDKIVVRFDPKVGDPSRFIEVKIP